MAPRKKKVKTVDQTKPYARPARPKKAPIKLRDNDDTSIDSAQDTIPSTYTSDINKLQAEQKDIMNKVTQQSKQQQKIIEQQQLILNMLQNNKGQRKDQQMEQGQKDNPMNTADNNDKQNRFKQMNNAIQSDDSDTGSESDSEGECDLKNKKQRPILSGGLAVSHS